MGKSNPTPRIKEAPTTRKPVDARISYLYQAATYFAGIQLDSHSAIPQPGLDPLENHHSSIASASGPVSAHSMDIDDKSVGVPTQRPSNLSAIYDESSIRILLSHMRGVSRKGQTSIPSAIKRSVCKRCNLLLLDGRNSSTRLENKSRGSKKPWANVLAVTCNSCGTTKRFPVGATRQPRRKNRPKQSKDHIYIISTTNDT